MGRMKDLLTVDFDPYPDGEPEEPNDPFPKLPVILKQLPNWVRWKLEKVDGRSSKVPYVIGVERKAANDNPADWVDFQTAINKVTDISSTEGLGFVINGEATKRGIVGFDLDGCRDVKTGDLTSWAQNLIRSLDSYTEITPSQTGSRIYAIGKLPEGRRVFTLAPSAGYGDKVRIEIFDRGRYFTVTGQRLGDVSEIRVCKLTDAYKLCQEIKQQFPSASNASEPGYIGDSDRSPVNVKHSGTVVTTKLELLLHGDIKQSSPFIIGDAHGNSVEYPSHSEADMALATLLAINGKNPEAIVEAFRESSLYRGKFDRQDYRENLIRKATESAERWKATNQKIVLQETQATTSAVQAVDPHSVEAIPPFDPSVINGIYAKFVDLITRGTTLCPQYAFVIAKTIVGARMAGKVKFKNLDAEPRYYAALIGESGTGKGESWRRAQKILQAVGLVGGCGLKLISSADSGAGIKDVFFDPPEGQPILCYVDEIKALGNKATSNRNPAILDTMFELADSTFISRVKAKKSNRQKAEKTRNDARFVMVMCGQNKDVFAEAFAGRTELGIYDRIYPEFNTPLEAGELPEVDNTEAVKLMVELGSLNYNCMIEMVPEAENRLKEFWRQQPGEIRKKVRLEKHFKTDAFMSAFGRGSTLVEMEDAEIAIRICGRQLVIRQACFGVEIPDRIGFYLEAIKRVTNTMREQLAAGVLPAQVARSRRDYEKVTNASRNNEEHIFARAWEVHSKVHLTDVEVKKENGHSYKKYIPVPD